MKKILSFILSAALALTLAPMTIVQKVAADSYDASRALITLKKENSTIAPGVTQEIGTLRKKYNGQQLVYYTMTVDLENEYANIHANYKDNDPKAASENFGMQTVMAQMDAAQANHNNIPNYTVVGGINGTGYNMSTGETRGILVMEGQIVHEDMVNASGNPEGFFCIDNDKNAHIYWNTDGSDWKNNKGKIQDAINIFGSALIKNGEIVCGTGNSPNARTAIGITDKNEVVMLVTDGKQAPFSEGCDMYELALILKKAGCVNAMNLDGGGSTTFVSRPEGEDTYRVINKPCDGAPRAVSASLFVASTAPDDKVFDRASIDADNEYITPGGTVNLTAKGVTAAGSAIGIPEGVTWNCDDEAGKFTSSGSTATFVAASSQEEVDKTVTISMMQDGKSVGKFTIHVVKPNVFNFTQKSYMVPYGESMPFEVTAAYSEGDSEHPVTLHGDFTFKLDNDGLGKLSGNTFTAHELGEEGAIDTGTVTATLTCNSRTATASIELGRGSEMVFDFENKSQIEDWEARITSSKRDAFVNIEQASSEDGHVHSGDHSMRITFDYDALAVNSADATNSACNMNLVYNGENVELKGATGFGAWVWVPDEEKTFTINPMFGLTDNYKDHELDTNSYQREGVNFDEGHWEWVHLDATEFTSKTDNDKWPFTVEKTDKIGFYIFCANTAPLYDNLSNNYVFYIDDFMVDYSPVTPDREAPTIKNVKTHKGADVYDELVRGTTYPFASNVVSFNAEAADDDGFNATGINPDSVLAYIDGYEVNARFTNGQIVVDPVTVADGVHTLKLYLSDNEGNTTNQTRQFKVDAKSGIPTVNVVWQKGDDRVLAGGVTYVDVVATDISKIQKIDLTMDLINNAQWEIKHADVNPKFVMSEPVIDKYENIATVTFTRRADWKEGDDDTIAAIPVRAWTYVYDNNSDCGQTNASMWKNNITPHNIELDVDTGIITYVDGFTTDAIPAFGMEHLRIETELFAELAEIHEAYPDKETWHAHDTALETVPDVEATCTERGLSGRKICKTCGSPVDEAGWGKILDVIDHKYETNENGALACTMCKELFNGEKDGKTYVDGVCLNGWQKDNTYYVGGKPLGAGLHQTEDTVDDKPVQRWHEFVANGVCIDKEDGYTGYFTVTDGVRTPVKELPSDPTAVGSTSYYYIEGGLPYTGWLFFRDGSQYDPNKDKPADTPTDTPDPAPETSGGETSEGTEPGMPDKNQQQAIMNTIGYHVHNDGRVHSVTNTDTRKCVVSGNIEYKCNNCGETTLSERLWWEGHKWRDPDHGDYYCTVCKTTGMDIGEATLNIMGENFEYTGNEIRAAVLVYYKGLSLSVRSDKNGLNGYVSYKNNTDIGVATVHIRGEGDFYGELEGTFNIVPQSVKTITKTETTGDAETVTVNLSWPEAKGAEYYTVIRYDYEAKDWIEVGEKVEGTSFSEKLPLNLKYYYQVASRATDENGDIFYAAKWSNPVSGTVKHVWGEETGKVEPQCEVEGSYKHTCTQCGYEETVTIPATGHTVPDDAWEIVEDATTSHAGSKKGTCTVCGQEVTEEIPKLPPVNTGTGGSTAPENKQETVTNPDGSTTTTTTKPDGSKTETTKQPDGTVTEKNTGTDGVVTETTTKPDNTVTEKVTQADGSATERITTPEGVTGQTNTDAEGEITSAEVVIPKNEETEKQDVVTAPVEVQAVRDAAEAPEIRVKTESADSTKVEIPVTEFGPGTVAVVVRPDGTEEVVRDCVIGENGVVLNVEGDVTLKIVDKTETFADVEEEHWAGDAVKFVAARELFKGTDNNTFAPKDDMTRGMLVTVLYRLAYEPETVAEGFADVKPDAWYADAVSWAEKNGVVNGYGGNSFGPEDNVNREQMVTILHRYAEKNGYLTGQSGSLDGYADAGSMSSWAAEAMGWAVKTGLIKGVDATHLAPGSNATRAEVATILERFCEKIMK